MTSVQTCAAFEGVVPANSPDGETVTTTTSGISVPSSLTTRQEPEQKYEKWVDRLFEEGRQLQQQTCFWTKAWREEDVGLYHDFEVPLEQLEYQIIGLVSDLYPEQLLNDEGA